MVRRLISSVLLAVWLAAGGISCAIAQPAAPRDDAPLSKPAWFKGNTHTHTLNSDGDSSPSVVVRWYRDQDYDFLALSDHCVQTPFEDLQREIDRENEREGKKAFLLIAGEEAGAKVKTTDRPRAVHVNGLGASKTVGVLDAETVREGLQACVDGIRAAGGLPFVNHPNFMWSLTIDDLFDLKNVDHFEVFNAHPSVHNFGGSGHPSCEEIWDALLSRGRLYYGVASDDAHTFKIWSAAKANPGRAWIVVRAAELSADALLDAIRRGDFYASTGVELNDVSMVDDTLSLAIRKRSSFGYRTQFIGREGTVLAVDETTTPTYRLQPGDSYVRARVTDSGGRCAWTQPLFSRRKGLTP